MEFLIIQPRLDHPAIDRLRGWTLLVTLLALSFVVFRFYSGRSQLVVSRPSLAPPIVKGEFYVSPAGTQAGDGSLERPWDLATALTQTRLVGPGSVIWLRGGTYTGVFTSKLAGSPLLPITVQQYRNERAIIDSAGKRGDVLTVRGEWTIYRDFEVTNSDPRRVVESSGSRAVKEWRGDGVTVVGPHIKLINLVVHDNADGIGFWTSAIDSEVYGCVIYNNGWVGPDRGHGHAIYAQNLEGTKRIADVIAFNNFGRGIEAYGTNAFTVGFRFEGNISFNNYSPTARGGSKRHPNLFVGAISEPADRITVVENYLYNPPNTTPDFGANLALGFRAEQNGTVEVRNNYVVGGNRALFLNQWRSAVISGNTFYASREQTSSHGTLAEVHLPSGIEAGSYNWNNNNYFDGSQPEDAQVVVPFLFNAAPRRKFEDWKSVNGFDSQSTYHRGRPVTNLVIVRQNIYEQGRANIVVYNWELKNRVEVDVSGIVTKGAKYEVRNAQDFLGTPVLKGTYDGRTLSLPMTKLPVATPVGYDYTPASTAPEFAVFIILTTAGAR
jgi:hypothetical protein